MRSVLVIDLGTQSMRGTLFSPNGEKRWTASHPVDSDIDGDRYEQDPHQWAALLRQLLDQCTETPQAIVVTAPLSGLVCLDGDGNVLHPAITYADRRCAAHVQPVAELEDTGMRPYISDPLPKTLWLKQERPQVYSNARYILDATGYLNWLLTGTATMDCYTALRCPRPRPQPRKISEALDIDWGKFGRPTQLGDAIGEHHGIPVIAATYDSKCAYVGSGISAPGEALDISGTVTSFGVIHDQRIIDDRRRIYSVPLHEQWLVRGSTAMSGPILEWARKELLNCSLDEFDELVNQAEPGAGGVVFLPYLAGERAPLWNPHAKGVFDDMTLATGRAQLARAVYEGLCFALRHITSAIEEHDVAINDVRLAGGLSQNATLNQIKADVLGVPCHALEDYELTSLGAARIANPSIAPPRIAVTHAPDNIRHKRYSAHFAAYLGAVNRHSRTFVDVNQPPGS